MDVDARLAWLPFVVETELERRVVTDPEWQEGARWGEPRSGHPEGCIADHVAEVLANVDVQAASKDDRARLRLLALVHDTFKYEVDRSLPRTPPNEHGAFAALFAARLGLPAELVTVVELHDEAYRAWRTGAVDGDWRAAMDRTSRLVERLGPSVDLYLRFFRCDNRTGSKIRDSVRWFEGFLAGRGHLVPVDPFPMDPSLAD